MTFLHFGLLLAFVPIIAAPIILHLLTLHKLRTIELSTYRFLFDGEVRSRRRVQFEDMLLAVLRTLFLLFIVMALARPAVSKWGALFGGMDSGRDDVLLIDASASMSITTDGRSAMQQAKQAASSIVENLPSQDRVTVIRVASRPGEICSRFASNPDAIRESIDQLEAGAARANWFAALLHTFQSDRLANPRIYVISDMQQTGWRELKTGETAGLIPTDTEVFVINVGSSKPIENQGIIAGVPDDQHVLAGLPVTLQPRVINFSTVESVEVPISVFAGDEEVARKTITVEPGKAAEAEVIYTPEQSGIQRLRYEIPDDRFAGDNVFRFTLSATSEVNVVLVNGHPSSDPLEDRGLFLRSALSVDEDQVRSLHLKEVRQSRLNAEHLGEADVVILADCGALSATAHERLRKFVADGGGLLILPGEQVDPGEYNRALLAANSSTESYLLAVRLRAATGSAGQTAAFDRFGGVDFAHPVFSVFRDPDEHYLAGTRAYRRYELALAKSAKNTWTLARFADGSPLIVAGRFGKGRVLLSAVPFDASWSNLPLQPEFVPLVLRMAAYVKRRPEVNVAAVIPAEGIAEISVDESWESANGSVLSESHGATPLEFEHDNGRIVAAFDNTIEAAFYGVTVSGGSTGEPKEQTLAFAVNTAADESHFDAVTQGQLSEMLPAVNLTMIDASPEAQQRHGQVGAKRELWRTLIFLALAVISVELLIATPSGSAMHAVLPARFSLTQLFNGKPKATAPTRRRNAAGFGSPLNEKFTHTTRP
ncbi:MAG: VWA domain-containing protein [Planctomycetes bacterium]|nr:VWA domain-containing protein [Planctomycetota bacterium]